MLLLMLMIFVDNVCWYFLNVLSLVLLYYYLNLSSWFCCLLPLSCFSCWEIQNAVSLVSQFVLFFPKSELIIGQKGISTLILGVLCEFQAFLCWEFAFVMCFSVLLFPRQTVHSTFYAFHDHHVLIFQRKNGGTSESGWFSWECRVFRYKPENQTSPMSPFPPLISLLTVSWIIYVVVFLIRQYVWNDNSSGSWCS